MWKVLPTACSKLVSSYQSNSTFFVLRILNKSCSVGRTTSSIAPGRSLRVAPPIGATKTYLNHPKRLFSNEKVSSNHISPYRYQLRSYNQSTNAFFERPNFASILKPFFWGSAAACAATYYWIPKDMIANAEEAQIVLDADPWLITGKEKPEVAAQPPPLLLRIIYKLLNFLKIVLGISLLFRVIRSSASLLYELIQSSTERLTSWLGISWNSSPQNTRIDNYEFAASHLSLVSKLPAFIDYVGSAELLTKEEIQQIPKISGPLFRKPSQDWVAPLLSTIYYDELLLFPHVVSYLVRSKRDGNIYLITSYLMVLPDLTPVPISISFDKVAISYQALKSEKILPSWSSQLSGIGVVRSPLTSYIDLTRDYRAYFMPHDLKRFMDPSDWIKYIGVPQSKAILKREGGVNNIVDRWRFIGPKDEIVVDIRNVPNNIATGLGIHFPETPDSLEEREYITSVSVTCGRWCAFLERNPIVKEIAGNNLYITSVPVMTTYVVSTDEFSGDMYHCQFQVTGNRGTCMAHVKCTFDDDHPVLTNPVLSVSIDANNENIELYKNSDPRYWGLKIVGAKTIPISQEVWDQPHFSTDLIIKRRGDPDTIRLE